MSDKIIARILQDICELEYDPEPGQPDNEVRATLDELTAILEQNLPNASDVDSLRWHLLHAAAELANAHWTLKRISGRTQYAEHGEDTEDQQALREIGEWCRKELGR